MLSGEILNGSSLTVALFSHVPLETLQLYRIMAAIATYASQQNKQNNIEDDDNENILLGNI